MITIYQIVGCPYCVRVREWVETNAADKPITFVTEPPEHEKRVRTIEVSGQSFVPTMKDEETGTVIADDDERIIKYLALKFNV